MDQHASPPFSSASTADDADGFSRAEAAATEPVDATPEADEPAPTELSVVFIGGVPYNVSANDPITKALFDRFNPVAHGRLVHQFRQYYLVFDSMEAVTACIADFDDRRSSPWASSSDPKEYLTASLAGDAAEILRGDDDLGLELSPSARYVDRLRVPASPTATAEPVKAARESERVDSSFNLKAGQGGVWTYNGGSSAPHTPIFRRTLRTHHTRSGTSSSAGGEPSALDRTTRGYGSFHDPAISPEIPDLSAKRPRSRSPSRTPFPSQYPPPGRYRQSNRRVTPYDSQHQRRDDYNRPTRRDDRTRSPRRNDYRNRDPSYGGYDEYYDSYDRRFRSSDHGDDYRNSTASSRDQGWTRNSAPLGSQTTIFRGQDASFGQSSSSQASNVGQPSGFGQSSILSALDAKDEIMATKMIRWPAVKNRDEHCFDGKPYLHHLFFDDHDPKARRQYPRSAPLWHWGAVAGIPPPPLPGHFLNPEQDQHRRDRAAEIIGKAIEGIPVNAISSIRLCPDPLYPGEGLYNVYLWAPHPAALEQFGPHGLRAEHLRRIRVQYGGERHPVGGGFEQ